MDDKYEEAARHILNKINGSMLALGKEIETVYGNVQPPEIQFAVAKKFLMAYLRETFPMQGAVPVSESVRELVETLRAKGFIPYCPDHIAAALIQSYIDAQADKSCNGCTKTHFAKPVPMEFIPVDDRANLPDAENQPLSAKPKDGTR